MTTFTTFTNSSITANLNNLSTINYINLSTSEVNLTETFTTSSGFSFFPDEDIVFYESTSGLGHYRELKDLLRDLGQKIGYKFLVRHVRYDQLLFEREREFPPDFYRIFFGGYPVSDEEYNSGNSNVSSYFYGESIWGYSLNRDYIPHVFLPTNRGIPLLDDEFRIWGEILKEERMIFFYLNPLTAPDWNAENKEYCIAKPILDKMFEVIEQVFNRFDEYSPLLARVEIERQKALKKFFENLVFQRKNARRDLLQNSITQAIQNLNSLASQQITLFRQRQEAERELRSIRFNKSDIENVSREWDILSSNPKVEKMEQRGSETFIVHTIALESKLLPDGTTRQLGKFMIKFSNPNNLPTVFSDDKININNFSHPHVPTHGDVCWGNMAQTLATLVAKFELGVVVNMIITFLEQPNEEDSWGIKIYDWPILTTTEGIEPRTSSEVCEYCGNALPGCTCDTCEYCDEIRGRDCSCDFCENCGEPYRVFGDRYDGCICDRCEYCMSLVDDCVQWGNCERYPDCHHLTDNCDCGPRCSNCGLIVDNFCDCDRCDNGHLLGDCDCTPEMAEP